MDMSTDRINRGLRALDSVKHCGDKMTPFEKENDENMRSTAPTKWKESQVEIEESTARKINN